MVPEGLAIALNKSCVDPCRYDRDIDLYSTSLIIAYTYGYKKDLIYVVNKNKLLYKSGMAKKKQGSYEIVAKIYITVGVYLI